MRIRGRRSIRAGTRAALVMLWCASGGAYRGAAGPMAHLPPAHQTPAEAKSAYEGARIRVLAGDLAGAIDGYEKALQLDTEYVDALYDLAWICATSAAPFRNPSRAVPLAEKLVELTHYKQRRSTTGANWSKAFKIRSSHVLATAFASAGNFQWAAEYARQALAAAAKLASDTPTVEAAQLLDDSRRFVTLYEAGQALPAADGHVAIHLPPR